MKNFVGYFELLSHQDKNEIEIAYLGLLEEYHNILEQPNEYIETHTLESNIHIWHYVIKCNEFGTYVGEPCQRPNNNIKYLSIVDF